MDRQSKTTPEASRDYDVIVVGAGFGGLYAVHRFAKQGLTVLGIEGAGGVGGVWYHNGYPGSRVDVESIAYCYYFSEELYRDWKWSERYAQQPELLRYLNHVADRFDIRRHFVFDNWVKEAEWHPERARYVVRTSTGLEVSCRFLVMATGQLSAAKPLDFPGLADFKGADLNGEWVQTSRWPQRPVQLEGRRVAIIGTGSSGVQTVTEVGKLAKHLHVFQRHPNFWAPAWNGPVNEKQWNEIKADVKEARRELLCIPSVNNTIIRNTQAAADLTPAQRDAVLEAHWAIGGHTMSTVFVDLRTNPETNRYVTEWVCNKIRSIVKDEVVAEKLLPKEIPFGSKRLAVDDGYYDTFNRPNVTLVDVCDNEIERITPTGIRLANGEHYELDLIIFAIGFNAFTGAVDRANIRNQHGAHPTDRWKRGPRTLLGMMTVGFPNLFLPTGPGSPSVYANVAVENEYIMDWIGDCMAYMDKHGYDVIEPTEEAEARWTQHTIDVVGTTSPRAKSYMMHFNEDGTSVFIPYAGGMDRYVRFADECAAKGYEGFRFERKTAARAA